MIEDECQATRQRKDQKIRRSLRNIEKITKKRQLQNEHDNKLLI